MTETSDKYSGMAKKIAPPKGKLGVLLPGMGAVRSTLIAGVFLVNSGHSKPIGSVTQMSRILQDDLYPDLYGDYYHKIRIEYYPPRGDAKEGWDDIDIQGWLGQKMQLKINFPCRDSILAAPVVLDLVLFLDLAQRAGMRGIQEWLSFYFKSPQCRPYLKPVNSLFDQDDKLRNTLRIIMGEKVIDHSGLDYYENKG